VATFLLVHGTFAKSAHWPALQKGLAEAARATGETAYFKQLSWSGQNRAAARQGAASAILKSVQDIQSNSNNERIFLIGHSHGGSAIAYFLKQYTEVEKTLNGCAFLSTPFIAMRPRNKAIAHAVFFFLYWFSSFIGNWHTFPPWCGRWALWWR
jgi:triacylglycerol esterase/lipase EstA (alpha/beta hydrolase family)